jgi:hypothetical protein
MKSCSNIARIGRRRAMSVSRLALCFQRLVACGFKLAATGLLAQASEESQPLPALRPPRPEIPPTFWEQHGFLVVAAVLFALALVALGIWYLIRPKPVVSPPPEVLARKNLAELRLQREDDALLSRVSHILRHYITSAFELSPGERTSAELATVLATDPRPGPELLSALLAFLRACDERKFSPTPPQPALGAVDRALQLIEQAEARRAAVRQTEATP